LQPCVTDSKKTDFDSYPSVEDSGSEGLSEDDAPQMHTERCHDAHNELHLDGDNQLVQRTFSESSGNEESDICDLKVRIFL
jgi:hypothetical protein